MNEPNNLKIKFSDPLIYDRLIELSREYSISVNMLVNVAVKKLIIDVNMLRDLRAGRIERL